MARSREETLDLVIGIVLIVLGILVATSALSLGPLVTIAAVAAIVVGILILAKQVKGTPSLAIILIVVGAIALLPTPFLGALVWLVDLVVGIVLIVLGVTKLMGRW